MVAGFPAQYLTPQIGQRDRDVGGTHLDPENHAGIIDELEQDRSAATGRRPLADLLDEEIPVIPGCEINDDPLAPLCSGCRARALEEGDALPVAWLPRSRRFIEKLATPDVTIADMIGDIDPIKAARRGLQLSDELTVHYGLLPRANRGIFAVNDGAIQS